MGKNERAALAEFIPLQHRRFAHSPIRPFTDSLLRVHAFNRLAQLDCSQPNFATGLYINPPGIMSDI